jgi:hypothetical protein
METQDEMVDRLRAQLGRDPSDAEIKAEPDRLIKLRYADMWLAEMSFRDEAQCLLDEED